MKKRIAILTALALAFCLTGCGKSAATDPSGSTSTEIPVQPSSELADSEESGVSLTDFSVRLFQECADSEENTLISPLSVLCALSMTGNGAKGETRSQMEAVLGMSVEDLNLSLYNYRNDLPQTESCSLSLANSIWFTDDERFTVAQDFLQLSADYYGADIYQTDFSNPEASKKDINGWISEKTDGRIPEILDEIPDEAIMYLVNAVTFDAKWLEVYREDNVCEDVFTSADGTEQTIPFLHSTEYTYLSDDLAQGFVKYYKDCDYAFVALLPNEGVTLEEYIASLTGERLASLLENPSSGKVIASIPKFETEYTVELSDVLSAMGMSDAFDESLADFSGLGTSTAENIFISRVLHQTYISVGEQGTEAGAATVVEIMEGAVESPDEPIEIALNRPFVYLIIDCEHNIPIFMGTLTEI